MTGSPCETRYQKFRHLLSTRLYTAQRFHQQNRVRSWTQGRRHILFAQCPAWSVSPEAKNAVQDAGYVIYHETPQFVRVSQAGGHSFCGCILAIRRLPAAEKKTGCGLSSAFPSFYTSASDPVYQLQLGFSRASCDVCSQRWQNQTTERNKAVFLTRPRIRPATEVKFEGRSRDARRGC